MSVNRVCRRGGIVALTALLFINGTRIVDAGIERLPRVAEPDGDSAHQVTFHTYDIEEVYSNVDGTVQFIELFETEGLDEQFQFMGKHVTTNANDFEYPSNLSGSTTANTHVLLATASFASLPGSVTPDFIIPENFFAIIGDTIALRETSSGPSFDEISYAGGELPIDGVNSLNEDGSTGVNSPTNFNGEVGSIDLSSGIPASSTWGMIVALMMFVSTGSLIYRRAVSA